MIWVALSAIGLALTEGLTFARIHQAQARAHARREDLILNQLLHLTGRTWQPPPAPEPAPDVEELEQRYVYNPEHLVDAD